MGRIKNLTVALLVIVLVFSFSAIASYADKEEIQTITITMPEPTLGNAVSFDHDFAESNCLIELPNTIEYAPKDGEYTQINGNTTHYYQAGHVYRFTFGFEPESGYAFASEISATVNGRTAKVIDNGNYVQVVCIFNFAPAEIKKVEITNLKDPHETGKLSYEYDCATEGLFWLPDVIMTSEDGVSFEELPQSGNDKYVPGNCYRYKLFFAPDEGYTFAENITVTVNGKPADFTNYGGYIGVVVDFPAPHVHAYVNMIPNNQFLREEATCEHPATYYYSCDCGEINADFFEYGEKLPHEYGNEIYEASVDGHRFKCKNCGAPGELLPHVPDREAPDENNPVLCKDCGIVIAEKTEHVHTPSEGYTFDKDNHYKTCTGCNGVILTEPHDFGQDGKCKVCGYLREGGQTPGSDKPAETDPPKTGDPATADKPGEDKSQPEESDGTPGWVVAALVIAGVAGAAAIGVSIFAIIALKKKK